MEETTRNWSNETLELSIADLINLLQHPIPYVAENAGAYLQRLSFQNDTIKDQIQILGGIPILISLLSCSQSRVRRRASGVLRNLSYTTKNQGIKEDIVSSGGLEVLANVLNTSIDHSLKENVTGILWNLSSSEELKEIIAYKVLETLVNTIIVPMSGLEIPISSTSGSLEQLAQHWSNVLFRNASGILKNLSSIESIRGKILSNRRLANSILYVAKTAFYGGKYDGSKSVENCICLIRNLTYGCCKGEDYGRIFCQSESIKVYLNVFAGCSNFKTIEAGAGIIQNLTANHDDVQDSVNSLNGISSLVKMLILESSEVVGTVSNALTNLVKEKRNLEQIGTFGMTCLIQNLPSEPETELQTSDESIISILKLIHRLVHNNSNLSTFLVQMNGMEKLSYSKENGSRDITDLVEKVLKTLWSHKKLRSTYKTFGFNEKDFLDNKGSSKPRQVILADGQKIEYERISTT